MFLMTDNQIVKEQFLVYINDLLSTGVVSDLFTQVRAVPEQWWLFFFAPCAARPACRPHA
jgi:hypothetical protein